MLKIVEHDTENNYRTLDLSDNLFHKALNAVLKGETRFYVRNPKGENFDLIYFDNNKFVKDHSSVGNNGFLNVQQVIPPYYYYDENNESKLVFDIFENYDNIEFYSFDEYTVVLIKLLLKHTDKTVYIYDDRILWFVDENDRLIIKTKAPKEKTMICNEEFRPENFALFVDETSSINLFHNVFLIQWLTDLPLEQIKYVEITMRKSEGIGSMIINTLKIEKFFEKYNIKTFIKKNSSRYKNELLEKYFNLTLTPEDSNDENTIYILSFFATVLTYPINNQIPRLSSLVLNENFINELDEYACEIIGNKRLLGVLVRGTDYIKSRFEFRALYPDELIKILHERLDEFKYDGIFLATEDKDYFDILTKEFKHKILAISQERYSINQLDDLRLISELEVKQSSKENYEATVEDNTVNYIYATYLLSKCESFITTPQCNGAEMARAFKNGKFIHDEILSSDWRD